MTSHLTARLRRAGAVLLLVASVSATAAGTASGTATEPISKTATATASGRTDATAAKPTVVVIGTGGTIAGVSSSRVSFQTYKSGKLPIGRLLGDLQPELGVLARVKGVDFATMDSASYTMRDYYDLSRTIDRQLATADAVVVSTGTTTMEELAYWLDLTVRSAKPVVLTGAMRPWTVVSSDGPANLYNAVMLAASGRTTCFGSVVLLNDQILTARDATKTNTFRLDTFDAPEWGLLGVVDEQRISLQRAPARVQDCRRPARWRTPFDLARIDRDGLPKVDVVSTYQDAGGEAVTAYADAGARGLVFAGAPSHGQFAVASEVAKRGTVLVAANRNNAGAVYPGVPGVVSAADLPPQKARLLLMLCLALTNDPARIQSMFTRYGDRTFVPAGER